MTSAVSEQTEHLKKSAAKKLGPRDVRIANAKIRFIDLLLRTGGNVSASLSQSGLSRRAAYEHLHKDKEFSDAWVGAVESARDDLLDEARRRAVDGVPVKTRGSVYRKKSDRLLIFLLRIHEFQGKWRRRVVDTGREALTAVQIAGEAVGLTPSQIHAIEIEMIERFKRIPLA